MTEKEDDYRRLAGDVMPLRVIFLDIDGVMITEPAREQFEKHRADRARYGIAVEPDRASRFILEKMMDLLDVKVCLATTWLWHTLRDDSFAQDAAVERLRLRDDQWFDPPAIYDMRVTEKAYLDRYGRLPVYGSKYTLIADVLHAAKDRGRPVDGWAFVDDDPGKLFETRDFHIPNFVRVDPRLGLRVNTINQVAKKMKVDLSDRLTELLDIRERWVEIRQEDGLPANREPAEAGELDDD